MKHLILLGAILFSGLAMARGDVAYLTGDKIHFQAASTWVSAYYSRTLCKADGVYYAEGRECVRRGGRGGDECREWAPVGITQPITSTRQRCKRYSGGENDNCREYETIRYHQDPTRTVSFWTERDQLVKTETITVEDCE